MKSFKIVKSAVLAVTVTAFLSITTSYADVHSSANLKKNQSSAVYHVIRGKLLADTLAQVAKRSGINFKINIDLGKEVVRQSIAAENWNIAVKSLLVNYNFTIIQESDKINTVIISGRNKEVVDTVTVNTTIASADDVIVIEPPLSIMHTEREWSDVE